MDNFILRQRYCLLETCNFGFVALMKVADEKIQMRLTDHAKMKVAHAMFLKGENFLLAAVLLHQKGGYRDVVLHLLCQGLEIVQKGLLLAKNYDKFKPELRKLAHDLIRGSDALHAVYSWKPLKEEIKAELQLLNYYYCHHLLRYGTRLDVLTDTKHVQFEAVMRKAFALTALEKKVFR